MRQHGILPFLGAFLSLTLGAGLVACTAPAGPPSQAAVASTAANFAADVVGGLETAKKTIPIKVATVPQAVAAVLKALPFRPTLTCARCNTGPAVAAAALYASGKDPQRKRFAITSIDLILRSQHWPNGALAPSPDGASVDTMFAADNIGMATLLLRPYLDAAHVTSWTRAVTGAADYLIASGNLTWYGQGNLAIGNTLTMALAYKLSGRRSYQTAYETSLALAGRPPQAGLWKGYGFKATKLAHRTDGSDGAGYFTEAGTGRGVFRVGFDPDYAMLQSDQLARLYLVTRDLKVLRMLNMVTNQLLARVNPVTNMMPGIGARKHYALEYFDSSAPAVLAYRAGRTDLRAAAARSLTLTAIRWGQDVRRGLGDRGYYALGMIPVNTLIATRNLAL